ncbi:hypothetical protein BD769DRAFT_1391218 [Suillus cothurnatus]|nr:hypothetical protein BD769DRAFT_1391218 [Suillus cothurnatus]
MTWSFVRKGKAAKDLVIESHIHTVWGSSIGSQWINEFYWSARGESAEDWLDELQSKRAKLSWPPVKIVFPSLKTVRDSVPGEQYWRTSTDAHQATSQREKKKNCLTVKPSLTRNPTSKSKNDSIGRAYVDSHNFAPSAWGTLSGSGFNSVFNVSQWPTMSWELSSLYDANDAERVLQASGEEVYTRRVAVTAAAPTDMIPCMADITVTRKPFTVIPF